MAHPDLDSLPNAMLPLAMQHLARYGEFQPFGSYRDVSGKETLTLACEDEEQQTGSESLVTLERCIRDRIGEGGIVAAGVCADVKMTSGAENDQVTDAICVGLEHCTGETVNVYVTYRVTWNRKYRFGELEAGPRETTLFNWVP